MKNSSAKYGLICAMIVLLFSSHIMAQKVTNVSAHQEGKQIVITYDLSEKADIMISGMDGNYRQLSIKKVTGDVGKHIKAGTGKRIVWDVLGDYDKFIKDGVRFSISAEPTMQTFIIAEGAYSFAPQWGVGIMAGQVRQWGWYVKARSNFQFKSLEKTDYSCDKDGYVVEDDGQSILPFYSGNKTSTELIVDGGTVVRLGCPLYLYAGGGFGLRYVSWETSDGKWVHNNGSSIIGFSGDIGLMGVIKGFTISAGVNTINFKYLEIQAGLGWMF